MKFPIPIINQTLELSDCAGSWFFDEAYDCWCLEDVLYTLKATTPKFQRLSIFVPAEYMKEGGEIVEDGRRGNFTAKTAPVIFENNSAGYMQMPHTWLGGPRDEAPKYLERGMVYVTCGSRGRESRDEQGKLCGKSPWTLVDLKTGIRFLRHNASSIPGDLSRIISIGWSAGGAMSSLLGVSGNDPAFAPFLEENGAFSEEKDDVYAALAYCPILDLDHADLAYEWQFGNDPENESSPAGPAATMTPFQAALSEKLAALYISYFNSLDLKHPSDGTDLTFYQDGRSGSGYDYLMTCLEESASKYLSKLERGELEEKYSADDYVHGNYTYMKDAPAPEGPGGPDGPDSGMKPPKDDLGLHHAGAAVMMPPAGDFPDGEKPSSPPSLGDLVSRPPKGVPYVGMEFPKIEAKGDDKTSWLSWDGTKASIKDLDTYILNHRRRMKPCTSFDTLGMDSGENQEFGTAENDYMHFNTYIASAIAQLKDSFPAEYEKYYPGYAAACCDEELAHRRALINPMNYIGKDSSDCAPHFRIRVGAQDADTAFTISMSFALKLANSGIDTDYALVWDKPHCEADYPGEMCDWIESIV